MLVKDAVYFIVIMMFIISTIFLGHSIKSERTSGNIILLTIIYTIYSIINLEILPESLNLDVGLELLLYRGILIITIILLIISSIISYKKMNGTQTDGNYKKNLVILLFLIILPVAVFCFSYFKEKHYINNSELIVVYSSGSGFDEEDYAYAIGDNYCKEISIGTTWDGLMMKKHLPAEFEKFDGNIYDDVEIDDDEIIIHKNNNVVYKKQINCELSDYGIEAFFINKDKTVEAN